MKIVKNSGNIVDFDANKLKRSLSKSGASQAVVERILHSVNSQLYDGISTKEIYKTAFNLLKKSSSSNAARYNLRSALQLLGPAGFFFEKYIARLFEAENYETKTNLMLQGKCVLHEIDVIIKKDNQISMVECKFHARRETNSDVKVPMYILSRFNDLKEKNHLMFAEKEPVSSCWIVTNNRFTEDAVVFAVCSGLHLLSWDYPKKDNIRTKIDGNCLYPVTCLTTLTLTEKDKLLILNIILAHELINNSESLEKIGLSANRIKNVIKEASELCRII